MEKNKLISKNILGLLADLFTYLRAYPENQFFLKAIVELGKGADASSAEEMNRQNIKNLLGKYSQGNPEVFSYLSKKYDRETEETSVSEKDLKLLLFVSAKASLLVSGVDSKLVYEYADSFHGLPEAILNKKGLDRKRYSSIYFEGFLKKYGAELGTDFKDAVEEWVK